MVAQDYVELLVTAGRRLTWSLIKCKNLSVYNTV